MTPRWSPQPLPQARALREAHRRVVDAERAVLRARVIGDREALTAAQDDLDAAQAAVTRLTGGAR